MSTETKVRILTLMLAAFTIGTDFTGALLLVPRIEDYFAADITTTQWVLNIYALVFAMGMVAGGRLVGHRRVRCRRDRRKETAGCEGLGEKSCRTV